MGLWAFAKLELRNDPLLAAIAATSLAKISLFSAQNLANTAWSLARLGILDMPLLEAISARALRTLSDFTVFDLSILVWSFDILNLRTLLEDILHDALELFAEEIEDEGDVGMFWFDF